MSKYADVYVSDRLLDELKRAQNEAVGMARYGRFRHWLHYANLRRWQSQGWHFAYVNYDGLNDRCTCGLVVNVDQEPQVRGFPELDLDRVQSARGHRNLPSLKGKCVAFIYDFEWQETVGRYFFKALCQKCLSHTQLLPEAEVEGFLERHNQRCMSARVSKVKE